MSCVEGSPAARAGIHEGDQLVEINGKPQIKYLAFLSYNAGKGNPNN